MYEFEKHPKLTEFIQEMATTGRIPREWTSFIETINEALRIHDVGNQRELLIAYLKENKVIINEDNLKGIDDFLNKQNN